MDKLKPLSRKGISAAHDKAVRYRLLNEPAEAESICLDILAIDKDNQQALVTLLLSLTDQFYEVGSGGVQKAKELLGRIKGKYEEEYYEGIIWERQAKSILSRNIPGGEFEAFERFQRAMECYEKAEVLRPENNEDAILRWNACARMIQNKNLVRREEDVSELLLE